MNKDLDNVQLRCSSVDSVNDSVRSLVQFAQNSTSRAKRLHVEWLRSFGDDDLQLWVPESPKMIELNQRLSKEITPKQREKLHSWQIEKLENDIKNEVELKYNTFDVNELNQVKMNESNEYKYKYEWSTSIEMLSMNKCGYKQSEDDYNPIHVALVKDKLTSQRVKTAYKNMKCRSGNNRCLKRQYFWVNLSKLVE